MKRSIIRLGVLLLLFDVYLTWARLEKDPSLETAFISRAPLVVQYLFFLTLNAAATLAHHLTVRLLSSIIVPKSQRYGAPDPSGANATPQSIPNPNVNADTNPNPVPSAPPTPSVKTPSSSQPVNAQAQQSSNATASQPRLSPNPVPASSHLSPDPSSTPQPISATTPTAPVPQRPPPPLRRASTAPPQHIKPLPPPTAASPTAISTALLVSSCAKIFPILLVIWGTDGIRNQSGLQQKGVTARSGSVLDNQLGGTEPTSVLSASAAPTDRGNDAASSSSLIESWLQCAEVLLRPYFPTSYLTWTFEFLTSLLSLSVVDTHLVLLSNIEALYILLGCGYLRAVAVAVAGQVARWAVQKVILGAVGVG